MAKLVGTMTKVYQTEYYEDPCGRAEVHSQHLLSVASGGGVTASMCLIRGTATENGGVIRVFWCPGVKAKD